MNADLIRQLEVLLQRAKSGRDKNDPFRVKSYASAIQKIRGVPIKITSADQIPLTKGGKIYTKVVEYVNTGKIAEVDEVIGTSKNLLEAYELFQGVAEIGPVKAKSLVDEHGITTIEELRGHQDLLNDKQRIGLKYYESDRMRIPRFEIKIHERYYKGVIKGTESGLKMSINGSYRRGAKDSGDIDVLLTHPKNDHTEFKHFVDTLIEGGYLVDHLAYGDKKYMGYGRLAGEGIARRIDIIYTPPEEYPFAQLYFTGSGPFNVKMRDLCAKRGLRLNEKALVDLNTGKPVEHTFKKEEDIFAYLGLEWVKPTGRLETYEF